MPIVSKTIRTDKNVWTFDVYLPDKGRPKIVKIHGDVTNKKHLHQAISALQTSMGVPKPPRGRPRNDARQP